MRLLFTGIEMVSNGFHDFDIGMLLDHWCSFNKIYIGEGGKDFTIHWNGVHKMYVLNLFELRGNLDRREHFEKVFELLKQDHKVGDHGFTWRWDRATSPETRVAGVTYWIYPYAKAL